MNIKQLNSPAFVIDLDKLEKNLKIFKRIKEETQAKVLLATKAYACYKTFDLIAQYLDGCTASSLHELQLSHEYFKKENHIFSAGYKETEIEEIASYASTMVFNSVGQKDRFLDKAKGINPNLKFGLRLNPEISQVDTSIYNPCAPYSRLGITKENISQDDFETISGILCHALCGNHYPELEKMLNRIEEQFSDVLKRIDWLDLGGGHLITDPEYDVESLIKLITKFKSKYNLQIILEPGESVVRNCGVLITEVLDILKNKKQIAILDTSATTHMPDVLEMPYQPDITQAKKGYTSDTTSYRLGASTCLSGDIIGEYTFDKPLQIGDRLIFEDMAQYTMVKTTTFNGMNLPHIYTYNATNGLILHKQFGYESFKARL